MCVCVCVVCVFQGIPLVYYYLYGNYNTPAERPPRTEARARVCVCEFVCVRFSWLAMYLLSELGTL